MSFEDSDIVVPPAFLDMPRWWRDGTGWPRALPQLIRDYCARWRLTITGALTHGSNAAVVPVARAGELFVLRLTPPGPAVADQVAALRFWAGRGTVQLIEADPAGGAMLLERLAIGESLTEVPVGQAMVVLGRVLWTRIDEMSDATEIIGHFAAAADAAGIDRGHGEDWVVFRTVDYWLWGLAAGLTEDPRRCRRLIQAFH